MIVLLADRSLLFAGLAARLALANRAVVLVPLAMSRGPLTETLRKIEPEILILDASDLRGAGFLLLDMLRQEPPLAHCPILIIAGGSLPDATRFKEAARQRGINVMLDAVDFDVLVQTVTNLIDTSPSLLASVAN